MNYDAPSIRSSLLDVEWRGGSSGRREAKMEVAAVVKKRGREKKSQKRGDHAENSSSNARSARCEMIILQGM
jgi:hypothetical protein